MVTVDVKLHQKRAERDLPRPRLVIGGKDVTDTSGGTLRAPQPGDRPGSRRTSRWPGPLEVDQAVAAARRPSRCGGPCAPPSAAGSSPASPSSCATTSPTSRRSAPWRTAYASAAGRERRTARRRVDPVLRRLGRQDRGHRRLRLQPARAFDYTIAEPYGVIGHIITWNSPALSLAMKVPPSLAAGNTVVIKPAEFTPFSALLFAELAREAGIPGRRRQRRHRTRADAGEALVSPPGRRQDLLHRRARHGAPHHGHRGRASSPSCSSWAASHANLLFADADLDAVVPATRRRLRHGIAGQGCALPTRLLVERADLRRGRRTRVAGGRGPLPVGDPLDPATYIGPLINEAARDRVHGHDRPARRRCRTARHRR